MQVPLLNASDQELLDLLQEHQVLESAQIKRILDYRAQSWNKHTQSLSGIFCTIQNAQLKLIQYASQEELASFTLESGFPSQARAMVVWFDHEGHEIDRGQLDTQQTGLLVNRELSFVISNDLLASPCIGQSHLLQLLPGHDLIASPDGSLLVVTERQAGRVQVFSLQNYSRLAQFEIREMGSNASIYACFLNEKLWITDPLQGQLGHIDLAQEVEQWSLNWQDLEMGQLSALTRGADQKSLYILALNPLLKIIRFDTENLSIIQEASLAGTACSLEANVPCDQLFYLPENEHIQAIFMHLRQSVRKICSQELSLRLSLAGERHIHEHLSGWIYWQAGYENPLLGWAQKSISDWLIELGFLSAEYLAYFRKEARLGTLQQQSAIAYQVPNIEDAPIEVLQRQAPGLEFVAGASEVILELFKQGLQQLGYKSNPEVDQLLQQEAVLVLQFLREHYVALIDIDLGNHQYLEMVIRREQLLLSLDQHLEGKQLPWRPGHRCPMCHVLLPNPRLCKQCGFALLDGDWQARKKLMSAEACDHLIPGQLLLALPQARRVTFLDAWLQVIVELEGAKQLESPIKWQEPYHVLALPDQFWLVCDRSAGKVLEINPQGQLIRYIDHRFQHPVLTSFRTLEQNEIEIYVLDQGNKSFFSFDRNGKLKQSWELEKQLNLKAPRDLQWTWNQTFLITDHNKVIEWDPESGETRQIWGMAQKIIKPVLARRLANGNTLILEASSGQGLIFSQNLSIEQQFQYWPPANQDAAWMGQGGPERWLVLHNGDLLGLGRRYWLLLQTQTGKTKWVQPWTGARRPPHFKQRLLAMANENPEVKNLRQIRLLQNLDSLALQNLLGHLETIHVSANEWVLPPDDHSGTLYFIQSGEIGIRKSADEPILSTLRAGDCFGEVSLALGEAYPAGFQAQTDSTLWQLQRGHYKQWVMKTGEVSPLLRELAQIRKALLVQYQSGQLQARMDRVKAQLVAKRLQDVFMLEDLDLEFLEELAMRLESVAYMPDQEIFGQDQSGDTLYFLTRGKVGVYVNDKLMAEVNQNDIFGEMTVLYQQPRSATIRSLGYCQVYSLHQDDLAELDAKTPILRERLLELAEERQLGLMAAQSEPEQTEEADDTLTLEVQALTRVRPAKAYALSRLYDCAFCFDESGTVSWQSGPLVKLYRANRLCVNKEQIWIANTGQDKILSLSASDGRLLQKLDFEVAQPKSVNQAADGRLVIADTGNTRIIVLNTQGDLLWEYTAPHDIMSPEYAELTPKGTVLFCDRELHMVYEIDLIDDSIVWSFGSLMEPGPERHQLNEPGCVRRLSNGGTLIADTGNDRLLLFSPVGTLMRSFEGSAEQPIRQPYHLELLENGDILVYNEPQTEIIRLGLSGQPNWYARLPN